MLKIGEFAKIFNVTIKTIRFYEEKELLNPCYIDKYSGYRYYDDENIKQMNQILYLKKLGFSLDEIKKYDEKLVKNKIEEYQEKIIQYTSNINILKDIDSTSTKGEEVKKTKKPFKFKGYYKKDYRIIGFWKTIALLKKNQKFKYREKEKNQDFELERITINPIENEVIAYINKKSVIAKYTKDYILDIIKPKSVNCYEYKKVNGKKYLFIEWKDEYYYVLEKIGGINFMEEMFENKEKMYNILTKDGRGLTLGKDIVLPEDKRGNVNTLIVGGSGAGKSSAYTVTNTLKMLGSYIIVDPLGEVYDKTHKYLKNNGYKIKVLNYENRDIENNIDEEDKYKYNPLSHIKTDADIESLANILVGNEDDEFWNDASKSLMKTIIYYVIENEDKKDLLTCFKLLGLPKESLFANFDIFEENTKAYKYYTILKTFPEKTYQSIVSTAILKLSFVINGIKEDSEIVDEFEFEELKDGKTAIFLMQNGNRNEDAKFNNIFISQFLATYKIGNVGQEHIYIMLDEVERLGKINDFARNLELARCRKLSISLMTNNMENIKDIYGKEYYNIMNSIDTQMLLGTNIKSDIMYFSELLGIDSDFIKDDLKNDELLIYEKGLKPVLARKDYFFDNEMWNNI